MQRETRIAILATDGFEQAELQQPLDDLQRAGFRVDVVSPAPGQIRGWKDHDWGDPVDVDVRLEQARADDYAALVLPGGVLSPDTLRTDPAVIRFVQAFDRDDKPLAAICHGPWLLAESCAATGRTVTSWPSLKTDLQNAGARWKDEEVVVDGHVITSRKPGDLPAFTSAIIEQVCRRAQA